MQLSKAKNNPQQKPFVSDGKLHIEANHHDGKITRFKVEFAGKTITAEVENFDILGAWKKVEQFIEKAK